MQVIQVNELYQLTFMPRIFPVSCYLVEEEDGLTLIDAALASSAKPIMRTAEKIGKPISRIVLTHGHTDHVGALDLLKEQLPNVPVYISKRDSRLLSGDVSMDPGEKGKINGGVPKKVKTRADVLISDGDRIGSLLAVSTPGHTPGSMSFIDVRNKFLIAGDAFQTRGGIAVSGQMRPFFPFPALATWDKDVALKSAKKILSHHPELLAVGHGKMLKHPSEAIKTAILSAEERLAILNSSNVSR